MGKKGDRLTNEASDFCQALLPRLQAAGEVSARKMFGGYGIFNQGKMFALINSSAALFLKADDENRQAFLEAGSQQHGKMPYFEVPQSVFDDDEQLAQWAARSIQAAHR